MKPSTIQWCRAGAALLAGVVLTMTLTTAETRPGPILSLTASTDNVSNARESVKIDVLRWSTDAESDALVSAWTKAVAAAAKPEAPNTGKAAKGKEKAAAPPPPIPEKALADAIEKAPTVGYLWSSEIAGYALRYAALQKDQDGSQTIRFITERRLGAWNDLWKPAGPGAATKYEFSVIELHLNAKGEGEGKASLSGKVVVDGAAKTIGLENYSALPVVLKNVRRRAS